MADLVTKGLHINTSDKVFSITQDFFSQLGSPSTLAVHEQNSAFYFVPNGTNGYKVTRVKDTLQVYNRTFISSLRSMVPEGRPRFDVLIGHLGSAKFGVERGSIVGFLQFSTIEKTHAPTVKKEGVNGIEVILHIAKLFPELQVKSRDLGGGRISVSIIGVGGGKANSIVTFEVDRYTILDDKEYAEMRKSDEAIVAYGKWAVARDRGAKEPIPDIVLKAAKRI